jgi:hypothetical protein
MNTSEAVALAGSVRKLAKVLGISTQAIYNWVNQNLRYVAIYLGDGGLVPHDADSIFRNRYGD